MLVRPDGRFSGTIGGGTLEWQALAEAQSMLAGPGASYRRLNKALGPELGQCCGGRVVLTLERFGAADLDRVTGLAAAERAGGFTTVAEQGRPMARTVMAPDGSHRRRIWHRLCPVAWSIPTRSFPTAASPSASAPMQPPCICSAPVMSGSAWCWRWRRSLSR